MLNINHSQSMNTNSFSPYIIFTAIGVVAVLFIWIGLPIFLIHIYGIKNDANMFSNFSGSVGALFTGFAFVGLLITIHIQGKELELQREELRLTRTELHEATEAQTQSAKVLTNQFAEGRRTREMSSSITQFDNLNQDWCIAVRQKIYDATETDIQKLIKNPESLRSIERLLNYLNHIGYLTNKKLLLPNPTLDLFYITLVRVWVKLGDYILERREQRGLYMSHLEWLTSESVKFWENNHPKTRISIYSPTSGESSPIDRDKLREQLNKNQKVVQTYVMESTHD